jgi:hypothetical protein
MMNTECELTCPYFQALGKNDKDAERLNRISRIAVFEGKTLNGDSLGSICGVCAEHTIIEAEIDRGIQDLLKREEPVTLPNENSEST